MWDAYAIYKVVAARDRAKNVRSQDGNDSKDAAIQTITSGVLTSADWYAI